MSGPAPPHVGVAVADASLRELVLRLAAVAGVGVRPASEADPASGSWHAAAVVVDAAVARASGPRRVRREQRVLVVVHGEAGLDVWQAAVRLGAEAVAELPRDEHLVATWLADTVEPASAGRLVACVGARGGAGASTLAAAVALAGAGQAHTLLMDLDPLAGGIDLVLGAESVPGARWGELAAARGTIRAEDLAGALPAIGALRLLSCSPGSAAPPAEAVEAAVGAGLRGHGLVVADLPSAPTSASSVAVSAADLLVVVVPAEVRSATAVAAGLARLAPGDNTVRLVVRHPGPGDLRPRDVAAVVGLDVAHVWPWDRRTGRLVDSGTFARGWRRTSAADPASRLVADVCAAAA